MASVRSHPKWEEPKPTQPFITGLNVLNSLTSEKHLFIPMEGKQVKWYICGPTVYDSSHLGHARTYLSFDIIRRILEDYFGYQVQVCMNITDVDDKIITGSRKNYLLQRYLSNNIKSDSPLQQVHADDILESVKYGITLLEKKLTKFSSDDLEYKYFSDKLKALQSLLVETETLVKSQDFVTLKSNIEKYFDTLSDLLDKREFASLPYELLNELSYKHSRRFENEFLEDLRSLGIKTPDTLTRVSEFIPEIIEMCQTIMKNGFAYQSKGSIYFDVSAFDSHEHHHYAKLVPTAYGNATLLAEGEGSLSNPEENEKRSPNDFALWKNSKPGEPAWDSPWGLGRPGWHIECSAMAGKILGNQIDIHAGGRDLKFPHHDNELAQSEACFGCSQWVNYFLHTGHLDIDGLKMSKSLKNFITIREMLSKYPVRHVRLLFLMQHWGSTMNYQREGTMVEVINRENSFKDFFARVEAVLGDRLLNKGTSSEHWNNRDIEFNQFIIEAQNKIHLALCNNFNTPEVIQELAALVTKANVYMDKNKEKKGFLLKKAAVYLTHILRVFGIIRGYSDQEFGFPPNYFADSQETSTSTSLGGLSTRDIARPYVNALVQFRTEVRKLAKEAGDAKLAFLQLTDKLRDEIMPELEVTIQDDGEFGFFFESATDRKARLESEAIARFGKRLAEREATLKKHQDNAMTPSEAIFIKYKLTIQSLEDLATAVGTDGKPISEKQKKNIAKDWEKQVGKNTKHQSDLQNTPNLISSIENEISQLKLQLNL